MENHKTNQKTYEYVFDYFLNKIISGELKLNDKIPPEREITELLDVSRNSVREVMHMLEITGLIEGIQGSGNYVRCDPEAYMMKSVHMVMSLLKINYLEIFHIRCAFEYEALSLAMEEATEEELEHMHEIIKKMDDPFSITDCAYMDTQFHNAIVLASHNRLLILYESMIRNFMDQFIVDLRTKILEDKKKAVLLQKAHLEIYDALVRKDAKAGRAAMECHFAMIAEQLEKTEE